MSSENPNNSAAPAIIGGNNEDQVTELAQVCSNTKTGYHTRAKEIPEELVNQALENSIFSGMDIVEITGGLTTEQFQQLTQTFISQQFHSLSEVGISLFNPKNEDSVSNLEQARTSYETGNMKGQADSLQNEYDSLVAINTIFQFANSALEEGKFENKHSSLLRAVNEVCNALDVGDKAYVLRNMAQICEWNHARGKFRAPTAVHLRHLPELFMAAPVWYIGGKAVEDTTNQDDPKPDNAVKFFCDAVGTQRFAWLYQMYNRRTRTLDKFEGRDIMPPHIAECLQPLKQEFDYLVIATPYHDKASQEWADPDWLANIDPFLFGFKAGLPYAVMIDRWSGNGLFPLIPEMIGDTIDHIRNHLDLLNRFPKDAYWYKGNEYRDRYGQLLGRGLPVFGAELDNQFKHGTLFEFLKEAT